MNLRPAQNIPRQLADGVHMVGGADLSDPRDCLCYLVARGGFRVLIDCGAGPSAQLILDLVLEIAGGPPTHLLITHAHIDHAGGAAYLQRRTGCAILIHADEALTLSSGDPYRSAATWYGLELEPASPDRLVKHDELIELEPGRGLKVLHTPGHTPGSLAILFETGGEKILFGQDIHGPFSPSFGSDIAAWRDSMRMLLELKADMLAEGHYGIFKPAAEVEKFIKSCLDEHPE